MALVEQLYCNMSQPAMLVLFSDGVQVEINDSMPSFTKALAMLLESRDKGLDVTYNTNGIGAVWGRPALNDLYL